MGDLDKIISLISGNGILDIRAVIANVVGPSRLPMGAKSTYQLKTMEPTQIATNIATADAYVLLGIAAESGQDPSGASGLLGYEGQLGKNSWPVQFLPNGNIYPIVTLLLPGEELFGQATDADVRIVVSQVTFR